MVYRAVEHIILDHTRNAVLGETIKGLVDQYFEAGKAAEALDKRLLCNDAFLATIASFVQTQLMDAITDHQRFDACRSTSVPTSANKDTSLAAEVSIGLDDPARKSFKSSSERSFKGCE